MSQIRGTITISVGRVSEMSSNKVDRSLFAAKWTVPPSAQGGDEHGAAHHVAQRHEVEVHQGERGPRSGKNSCHRFAMSRSVYIAPLGVPVLPEV